MFHQNFCMNRLDIYGGMIEMVNQQRAELSKKNPYWIPREKYYELLYFSRQYNTMRQEKRELLRVYPTIADKEFTSKTDISSPVEKALMRVSYLNEMIGLIENTAKEAGDDIYKWLLIGVTSDRSYDFLSQRMDMPASKDLYYKRYRKYFYLLSKKR